MLKTFLLTRDNFGGFERPDVDKIDGLSPVIAIEQKTTSKSPRSTVGTITEIYDSLCLLYAQLPMLIAIIQASRFVWMSKSKTLSSILATNASIFSPG
jgi:excinuclease UvrABC ATPase subunit